MSEHQRVDAASAHLRAERDAAVAKLAAVEKAMSDLGDVYKYGERNSTYHAGAQAMERRIRAALASEPVRGRAGSDG